MPKPRQSPTQGGHWPQQQSSPPPASKPPDLGTMAVITKPTYSYRPVRVPRPMRSPQLSFCQTRVLKLLPSPNPLDFKRSKAARQLQPVFLSCHSYGTCNGRWPLSPSSIPLWSHQPTRATDVKSGVPPHKNQSINESYIRYSGLSL